MKIVAYQPEMGEVVYPEGFLALIEGLPVEAQSKFFRTTLRSAYCHTRWSERTLRFTRALEDDPDVKALIVKDGLIAGAMIEEWFLKKETPVLPDQCVCTYDADDNNGAGSKQRTDYTYLVCVPACGH